MTGMTDAAEIKPPPNVLLAGINGSTAYGLATEDSDVDMIGCYASPTVAFHGLHPPYGKAATWVSTKPDATFHEAGKLASLLLKGNPTVTELLWLDQYETATPEGEELIAIRSAFLSRTAVRNAYLGYASGQFKRLENRGDGSFSADTRKRTAKHARHLYRLHAQGIMLWQTGRLAVRLGVAPARAFLESIGCPERTIARILPLIAEHMNCFGRPTKPAVRRLSRRLVPATLAELALVCAADAKGRGDPDAWSTAEAWFAMGRDLKVEERPAKGLLTGDHLIAAGMEPGPAFRPLLAEALAAQDAGEFDDEGGAVAWLLARIGRTS